MGVRKGQKGLFWRVRLEAFWGVQALLRVCVLGCGCGRLQPESLAAQHVTERQPLPKCRRVTVSR